MPKRQKPAAAQIHSGRVRFGITAVGLALIFLCQTTPASPVGGTVTQGSATFNRQGSQLTIRTSDRAFINWQSFNIGVGETTTFLQPSSSSVVWNRINDVNASQILGNLNANGYVVLQNAAGIYIGGQAKLTAQGLLLTTAPIPTPDLAGGGAWQFSAPPPSARIINYGEITAGHGGSVFLLAHDIENHGTISADQGQVGLYAGNEVLISERPDGRGLSARVRLPAGSVDNSGRVIADAGTIAMQAQIVNQGGLVQANSVRERNGVIELVASDSLTLGDTSVIAAQGDTHGLSRGGDITLRSGNHFVDSPESVITVSGGQQGGNGGNVEVSAVDMPSIRSRIDGQAARGWTAGKLFIDPENIRLVTGGSPSGTGSIIVNENDPPNPGTLTLSVDSFANFSQITLQAIHDIELGTVWRLTDSADPTSTLTLQAGRSIIFDNNSGIAAGRNWTLSLSAGSELTSASGVIAGQDGIYLHGNSFIQTQNGNINLHAGNDVIVNPGPSFPFGSGEVGNNGIRTLAGGSISVRTEYGDVNTGGNPSGYNFTLRNAPYYRVSQTLGGISTAAGGDLTIDAAGNVTSYLPLQNNYLDASHDGGTGAFGPQPGNVIIISRNGSVSGHYVLANGIGTVSAATDIGAPTASGGFALSLIKGTWNVFAPHGSIYLQDIRNPNGVFDDRGGSVAAFSGYHFFDYDPFAAVVLQAGIGVEITGAGAPHGILSAPGSSVPILFPPSLDITAGHGGIVLDTDVTLFPSPHGNLHLTTLNGGNFQSHQDPLDPLNVTVFTLAMSDTAARQWDPFPSSGSFGSFGINDHASSPPELNNPDPVTLSIDGSMNNVNLRTTKATQITVNGDMFNTGFLGENLHATDITSINVAHRIYYPPIYTFTGLSAPITGADPLNRSAWDSIFSVLVDPNLVRTFQVPANATLADLRSDADALRLVLRDGYSFPPGLRYDPSANPGFIYDRSTGQLGFRYRMSDAIRNALEGTLQIVQLDSFGNPVIRLGQASLGQDPTKYYFATSTVSFVAPAVIERLYQASLGSVKDASQLSPGFQMGGPGQFNITCGGLDLGSSAGIYSWGIASANNPVNYGTLAGVTRSGAALNLNVAGDLSMLTSTIASIYGGDLTVNTTGNLELSLGNFSLIPPNPTAICFGIFTSGHSDVHVTAGEDINVGGARIGTFNGGNVFVTSLNGNVNAGNGANSTLVVPVIYFDPLTHQLTSGTIQSPKPYGSGILAISPTPQWQTPGGNPLPGNITIDTPHGNIVSTLGGIQQFALNGSIAGGPTITLTAGTPAGGGLPAYPGNVDLGEGGVVGGTINITAQGTISGLIVSRQNATITAAQSFSGTLLAGGTANVSASAGGVSGTVIGISGVNVSSSGGVTASLLGQNVSVGGAQAQSTLGTTATATSSSQAAAQQSNNDVQQVAKNTPAPEEDEGKKKGPKPVLTRRVGRVTVILPPNS